MCFCIFPSFFICSQTSERVCLNLIVLLPAKLNHLSGTSPNSVYRTSVFFFPESLRDAVKCSKTQPRKMRSCPTIKWHKLTVSISEECTWTSDAAARGTVRLYGCTQEWLKTRFSFDMVSLILHKVVCLIGVFEAYFKIRALATMSHSLILKCSCQAFSSSAWLSSLWLQVWSSGFLKRGYCVIGGLLREAMWALPQLALVKASVSTVHFTIIQPFCFQCSEITTEDKHISASHMCSVAFSRSHDRGRLVS